MKKSLLALCSLVCGFLNAQTTDTIIPHVSFTSPSNIVAQLIIPEGYHVYTSSVSATAAHSNELESVELVAINPPAGIEKSVAGDTSSYYEDDIELHYILPETYSKAHTLTIGWQACTDSVCFMPASKQFHAYDSVEAEPQSAPLSLPVSSPLPKTSSRSNIQHSTFASPSRVLFGYADATKFNEFLTSKENEPSNPLERALQSGGTLLLLLAVLVGGLLLNLTPCVLPLIPVNLAILGIGTNRASRKQGLIIGTAFGLGIALTFGALGIISVLTGTAFGEIQSTPIFNATIAILFSVLALAMLGVFTLDFSTLRNRFKRRTPQAVRPKPTTSGLKPLFAAFSAGVGSALLAGACVAPVLVWTLIMASTLIASGNPAGLLLPLVLGIGMALPWPFLGGGVATLPRPGKWMNHVKYLFAIIFIAFAARYAYIAWQIILPDTTDSADGIAWLSSEAELAAAVATDPTKPALIYLTAEGCTACRKMESSTFINPTVIETSKGFHLAKIDCTYADNPEIRTLLQRLDARGFPFFAIFAPTAAQQAN